MEVLVVMIIGLILLLTLIFILAPMPGRIAKRKRHPHAKTIRLCGWTSILSSSMSAWVLALMWAHNQSPEAADDFASKINEQKQKKKGTLFPPKV